MNKAFIFDLDGVLINNEPKWEVAKKEIFVKLFGQEIYEDLGSTVGLNMTAIHEKATELGATVSHDKLIEEFHKYALSIYSETPITEGIQELGASLINNGYVIGIVSASPLEWMNLVINRLGFKTYIGVIISLQERDDLAHKPAPDGYLEAIKVLEARPSSTIVLEDSNAGIASAKAAGVYVVGLKQNLIEGYAQENADVYVENVDDVIKIIKEFSIKD